MFPAVWPVPRLHGAENVWVEVETRTEVRLDVTRPDGSPVGTLLLIHGMGGSAESPYMRRTAAAGRARGWIVARMNLRNCGGTESRAATLYNAGQSGDVDRVFGALESRGFPRPFMVAGFSLGGNMALRYAGLSGAECRADAVAGVNPPVDLAWCLRALERPGNAVYQIYFSALLCAQVSRVRKIRALPGPRASLLRIRGVRAFDEAFTAPDAGFASSADYYAGASSAPNLASIHVPALIVSAANDPFVPVAMFAPHAQGPPGRLRFLHPRRGGHVGYWNGRADPFWAAVAILDFFEQSLSDRRSRSAPGRTR